MPDRGIGSGDSLCHGIARQERQAGETAHMSEQARQFRESHIHRTDQPVEHSRALVDKLRPKARELTQRHQRFAQNALWPRSAHRHEVRQRSSIQTIGLGPLALRPTALSRLQGVQEGHLVANTDQLLH